MKVVCLSDGWLWKWKPLDDPGTHYPQAIQLLNAVKCNLTKLTTKSAVSVLVSMVSAFWHTSMRMAIVGSGC
jgi:hypothetical protein